MPLPISMNLSEFLSRLVAAPRANSPPILDIDIVWYIVRIHFFLTISFGVTNLQSMLNVPFCVQAFHTSCQLRISNHLVTSELSYWRLLPLHRHTSYENHYPFYQIGSKLSINIHKNYLQERQVKRDLFSE